MLAISWICLLFQSSESSLMSQSSLTPMTSMTSILSILSIFHDFNDFLSDWDSKILELLQIHSIISFIYFISLGEEKEQERKSMNVQNACMHCHLSNLILIQMSIIITWKGDLLLRQWFIIVHLTWWYTRYIFIYRCKMKLNK